MPKSVNGPITAALLLIAGCASPFSSGTATRNRAEPPAAGPTAAAATPQSAQNAPAFDRKPPIDRSAAGDQPASERRISELLTAARARQQAGRLDVAQYGYEQVLRLDPQNMTAHYQLACIADDQGRFAEAERHYSVLLRQAPHDPDLLASLGWSYLLQQRYDDCESVLREALRYAPHHQTALYNLGWLYGTRGDFDQALAVFRTAGTEADARRALAELQQNTRTNPGTAAEAYAAAPVVSAPAPWIDSRTDAREPQLAIQNGSRIGGVRAGTSPQQTPLPSINPGGNPAVRNDRSPPVQIDGMFSEIDAYARSSPTQANHARQVESQTAEVGAANRTREPSPGGTEPVGYEPGVGLAGGQQRPMITPGIPGAGSTKSASGAAPWNALPPVTSRAVDGSAGNATTTTSAAEWQRTPARDSRLPDWTNGAGPRGPGRDPSGSGALRGSAARQDAQLTAAQLGMGAGPGGVFMPIGDSAVSSVGSGTTDSRPIPIPTGIVGGRPPASAENSLSSQQPGPSRQSPATQTAGFAPSSSLAAPGLPPWPGRSSILAPVPTDVRASE
jgi:Tfp pilus assembly protein PilF